MMWKKVLKCIKLFVINPEKTIIPEDSNMNDTHFFTIHFNENKFSDYNLKAHFLN